MVTEGRGKGVHTSHSAVRRLHAPDRTFKVRSKAEEYLAGLPRKPIVLNARDHQRDSSLWIFTDGSTKKSNRLHAARAGWGIEIQAGDVETSIESLHGSIQLFPACLNLSMPFSSTNNVAELQALHQAIQWLTTQESNGKRYSSVVICPDSTYAMNHVRGVTSPKKNKEYVAQVRADYLQLEALLPATNFVWHWVKGHSKEDSREARGNDRADKLADIGAEEAELRPRLPQTPRVGGRRPSTPPGNDSQRKRKRQSEPAPGATEPGPRRSRSINVDVDLAISNSFSLPSNLDIPCLALDSPCLGSTVPTQRVG